MSLPNLKNRRVFSLVLYSGGLEFFNGMMMVGTWIAMGALLATIVFSMIGQLFIFLLYQFKFRSGNSLYAKLTQLLIFLPISATLGYLSLIPTLILVPLNGFGSAKSGLQPIFDLLWVWFGANLLSALFTVSLVHFLAKWTSEFRKGAKFFGAYDVLAGVLLTSALVYVTLYWMAGVANAFVTGQFQAFFGTPLPLVVSMVAGLAIFIKFVFNPVIKREAFPSKGA